MASIFPEPLERLIRVLSRLPTIGRKSAQRLALHLLSESTGTASELAEALARLHGSIRHCRTCFFVTDAELCAFCTDPTRDPALLCVVEDPADVLPFEKSAAYRGRYHVLHGRLSPLQGITAEDLRIAELIQRLADPESPVRELILATNPNVDGDATALYISREVSMVAPDLQVTRLGLGLQIGASLEFADELTLRKALEGRRRV